MKNSAAVGQNGPFVDISHSSLKVLYRGRGLEIALERTPGGRLTSASREDVRRGLRDFLNARQGSPVRALCAVPTSGVSLRSFTIPRAPRDETAKALSLQMEKEFPLPPAQLAWGYRELARSDRRDGAVQPVDPAGDGAGSAKDGDGSTQEFTIVALRKEVLDDYEGLLAECGLRPSFRVGGFESNALCGAESRRHALLDIGRTHSELIIFEGESPVSARVLSWGGEHVTRAISEALEVEPDEAEELKRGWKGALDGRAPAADSPAASRLEGAIETSVARLLTFVEKALAAGLAPEDPSGDRASALEPRLELFLAGDGSRLPGLPAKLAERLARDFGSGVSCRLLEVPEAPGVSAVTLGLQRQAARATDDGALVFLPADRSRRDSPREGRRTAPWLAAAALLAVASLCLRYVVPLIGIPELERSLNEKRETLDAIPDKKLELSFLRYVERSRKDVAYLDLLAAIARTAPSGMKLESVAMSRSGDIALEGSVANQQQANGFRRGLLVCGLFSNVVLQLSPPAKKSVAFRLQATATKGASLTDFRQPKPIEAPQGAAKPYDSSGFEAQRGGRGPRGPGGREGPRLGAAAPKTPPLLPVPAPKGASAKKKTAPAEAPPGAGPSDSPPEAGALELERRIILENALQRAELRAVEAVEGAAIIIEDQEK